jgi:hypothetical protein
MIFTVKSYVKVDFNTKTKTRYAVYNDGSVLSSTVAFDYDKDRDGPRQWIECDLPDDPGFEDGYNPTLPPDVAKRWSEF